MSEKMRRYNLSLQRPQEKLRQRAIESERMRKEREPEERWKKWKKWLGLADFTEYDGPFSIFIMCIFLFSDFFWRDKFMRFRIVQVPIQDSSDECFIWYIFHYFECKSLDSFLSCYKSCYTLFF